MKRFAPIVLLCMCLAGCLWSPRHLDTMNRRELSCDFTLTLTQPTNAFHVSGSIVLEACFKNNSGTTIEANPFFPEPEIFRRIQGLNTKYNREIRTLKSSTTVQVKRIAGNPPNPPIMSSHWNAVAEPRPICLSPHKEQRFLFDLTNCVSWSRRMDEGPGVFEVDIIFESEGQPLEAEGPFWEGKISSNKIRIEILK